MKTTVSFEVEDTIAIVTIARPETRNAVDRETAEALAGVFWRFDTDDSLRVAILTGAGGCFCAGADLNAVASGSGNRIAAEGDGPLGCTRMVLGKPVIAAVEGFAVAGGLELALWCDMRIAARDAVFGVYCRRFGVPLIDGGTVRLPRLIGMSHALDLILTGRTVSGDEALRMGLATGSSSLEKLWKRLMNWRVSSQHFRNAVCAQIGARRMRLGRCRSQRRLPMNTVMGLGRFKPARRSLAPNASNQAQAGMASSSIQAQIGSRGSFELRR